MIIILHVHVCDKFPLLYQFLPKRRKSRLPKSCADWLHTIPQLQAKVSVYMITRHTSTSSKGISIHDYTPYLNFKQRYQYAWLHTVPQLQTKVSVYMITLTKKNYTKIYVTYPWNILHIYVSYMYSLCRYMLAICICYIYVELGPTYMWHICKYMGSIWDW